MRKSYPVRKSYLVRKSYSVRKNNLMRKSYITRKSVSALCFSGRYHYHESERYPCDCCVEQQERTGKSTFARIYDAKFSAS